jgi:hypothetical protein
VKSPAWRHPPQWHRAASAGARPQNRHCSFAQASEVASPSSRSACSALARVSIGGIPHAADLPDCQMAAEKSRRTPKRKACGPHQFTRKSAIQKRKAFIGTTATFLSVAVETGATAAPSECPRHLRTSRKNYSKRRSPRLTARCNSVFERVTAVHASWHMKQTEDIRHWGSGYLRNQHP